MIVSTSLCARIDPSLTSGLQHLTKNLAIELGGRHILTNCIAPGFFPSKMANGLIDASGGLKALGEANPNGRLGLPEDIVGAVVFLCSKASEHINGDVLVIDGGNHLGMFLNYLTRNKETDFYGR